MKIWHYIQGNRKGKEAHRVEKEAMKDPFLADALEGYEKTQGNHQREVAKLQREVTRLQKRITNKSANKKPNHLKAWGIAASILIVVGMGTWYLLGDSLFTKEIYSADILMEESELPAIASIELPEANSDSIEIIPQENSLAQVTKKDIEKKDTPKPEPIVIQEDMEVMAEAEEVVTTAMSRTITEVSASDTLKNAAVPERQQAKVSTENISNPYPTVGMEAYMEYIQRNLKRPTDEECSNAKGPVVVMFKIGQSGRPYNIRVTQGLCSSINQEAIRLIINGPDWKKGATSDEATITINF